MHELLEAWRFVFIARRACEFRRTLMIVHARPSMLASVLGLATSVALAVPAVAAPTPAPYVSPTPFGYATPYGAPASAAPAPYGASPTPYASQAPSAQAAPGGAPANAIPSGTTITGKMQTQLDTAKAEIGQGFSMVVTRPYPNGDPGYAGAIIRGHVGDVQRAGQGRSAVVTLVFDSIVLPSTGQSAKVTGHVVSVQQKHKTAIGQQAIGAGLGAMVGNAIGGGIGAIAGAAGGFALGNNRKTNYVIPADAEMTIQTDAEIARPQARQ
ncbi:MAG: hypothetical protein NVS1B2_00590 [Vulcanimicrobiaceae bacterium]